MPSKSFLKGKHQLTLYPTTYQLKQLKIKMAENGYKTLTKYLIDMGLNATVKQTIEVEQRNTQYKQKETIGPYTVVPNEEHPLFDCDFNGKVTGIKQQKKTTVAMCTPLTKGGGKK